MRKTVWYVLLSVLALLLAVIAFLRHQAEVPHSVTVTWDAPAARDRVTVIGYNVYRRTFENGSFVKIAEKVAGPPYEDRLVNSGRKYVYAVTSVDNGGGESPFSAEVTVEIP